MKGYTEYKVGKEPIFVKNLIDDNVFSKELFLSLLDQTLELKKFWDPDRDSQDIVHSPGIQYNLSYSFGVDMDKVILFANNEVDKLYKSNVSYNNIPLSFKSNWLYYSYPSEQNSFWHVHTNNKVYGTEPRSGTLKIKDIPAIWTYVVYINVPNNIKTSGGKIHFNSNRDQKTDADNRSSSKILSEFSYTPSQGDFIMFPSWMPHLPEPSTDQNVRVVLGGNTSYQKQKSLI